MSHTRKGSKNGIEIGSTRRPGSWWINHHAKQETKEIERMIDKKIERDGFTAIEEEREAEEKIAELRKDKEAAEATMNFLRTTIKKSWHACRECNLAMGGVVPKDQYAITVMAGKCPYCGKQTTLVPHCDYDWPKEGIEAVWD